MEYFVADSYKDAERIGEPFENENGRRVVKIRYNCPRCGGSGHYSYNSLDGTMCYGCRGTGKVVTTVRAYTEKEKLAQDRAAARRKEKKEEERQAKIKANIENKEELRQKLFAKIGFAADGTTWIPLGNTYEIKDDLKAAGFKYDPVCGWHGPAAASFNCIPFTFDELYVWHDESATCAFVPEVEDIIKSKKKLAEISASNGEFIGEVKERLRNLNLVLTSRIKTENRFGFSECLNFDDGNDHYFCWWTATCPDIQVGDTITLTGTVKEHNTYKGKNFTVLTRCKIDKEA